MYTLLDSCLDRLDIFEFLNHVEDGLKDHYDIKVGCQIFGHARSSSHLGILEAVYIKTRTPIIGVAMLF